MNHEATQSFCRVSFAREDPARSGSARSACAPRAVRRSGRLEWASGARSARAERHPVVKSNIALSCIHARRDRTSFSFHTQVRVWRASRSVHCSVRVRFESDRCARFGNVWQQSGDCSGAESSHQTSSRFENPPDGHGVSHAHIVKLFATCAQ